MDVYGGTLREAALSGALLASFEKVDSGKKGTVTIKGLRDVLTEHKATAEFGGQPEQVSHMACDC